MLAKNRVLVTSVVSAWLLCSVSAALAQDLKPQTFKLGDISLRLTNIEVVTGEPTDGGGLPKKPIPLPADTLLPPDSQIWITFDYLTNFKKSDAPEGASFLAVGLEIPQNKPWGYGPASIGQKSGKGSVRLSLMIGGPKVVEFDEQVKLVAYTRTNDGKTQQLTSETAIPVKFRRDGNVVLSTTQFEELQAMKRRLAELEKKVQALEKSVPR